MSGTRPSSKQFPPKKIPKKIYTVYMIENKSNFLIELADLSISQGAEEN